MTMSQLNVETHRHTGELELSVVAPEWVTNENANTDIR